jgi:hypothetical protein
VGSLLPEGLPYRREPMPPAPHLTTAEPISSCDGSGLRGVEVHRGKPILYSLGNFIYQPETPRLHPADYYEALRVSPTGTPADTVDVRGQLDAVLWESVVATCRLGDNRVDELRLYPLTLGYSLPRPQAQTAQPRPYAVWRPLGPLVSGRRHRGLSRRSYPGDPVRLNAGNLAGLSVAVRAAADGAWMDVFVWAHWPSALRRTPACLECAAEAAMRIPNPGLCAEIREDLAYLHERDGRPDVASTERLRAAALYRRAGYVESALALIDAAIVDG